jgi:hypothetical protein
MWHVRTESTSPTPLELVAGVDLLEVGGGALCVLERCEDGTYAVRYLHDFTRLVTHPRFASIVAGKLAGAEATLTVNGSRVGAATVGRFHGCGQVTTWSEGPEATKDLIANVRELINDRRLRFARGLGAVTMFLDELRALSAARIGWATPLAMALALACWGAEQYQPVRLWGGGGGGFGPGSWGHLSGPRKPGWMP